MPISKIKQASIDASALTGSNITDGTIAAADLATDAVTTAKIADGGITTAKIAADAITTAKIADTVNLGRRNLIINGAMQVAQRNTSSSGVGASSGYFTCDRWEIETGNSAGRFSMAQNSDSPDGFNNSLSLACSTADTSIASNEYLRLQQVIEAQNLQNLAKGTSSAKQFTLSFYVKGNAAATYGIEIYDLDNTRHICTTFNVTTSWNRISVTFDGDTTGAINDDNGGGFQVGIWLHAGSDYNGGTLSTSWASVTNANRTSSSNTSFYDSTSRTFFITGVQLEAGSGATPFEHHSFAEELALCERYFYQTYQYGTVAGTATRTSCLGRYVDGAANYSSVQIPNIRMRAGPTATIYSTNTTNASGKLRIDTGDINGVVADNGSNGGGFVYANNVAVANQYGLRCHIVLDAEL